MTFPFLQFLLGGSRVRGEVLWQLGAGEEIQLEAKPGVEALEAGVAVLEGDEQPESTRSMHDCGVTFRERRLRAVGVSGGDEQPESTRSMSGCGVTFRDWCLRTMGVEESVAPVPQSDGKAVWKARSCFVAPSSSNLL